MSASWLASGSRVDRAVAVDEHTVGQAASGTRWRRSTSGRVLISSSAGRIVCAVVCAAPDTIPSARPQRTIIVPK